MSNKLLTELIACCKLETFTFSLTIAAEDQCKLSHAVNCLWFVSTSYFNIPFVYKLKFNIIYWVLLYKDAIFIHVDNKQPK